MRKKGENDSDADKKDQKELSEAVDLNPDFSDHFNDLRVCHA